TPKGPSRARRSGSPPPSSCWPRTTTVVIKHGSAGPTARTTSCLDRRCSVARDRIPTSRVGRTAKVGRLAAGQAIRQAGTRAANVTRGEDGKRAALERRHIDAAEQIVAALGTMKGAAMEVGQVMSFLDIG